MITEDYVSFEVSKLLKEKGFNEYCRAFWKDWDNKIILCNATRSHVFDFCNNQMLEKEFCFCDETNIAAPTIQMAMKWLRKEHNLYIRVDRASKYWHYTIRKLNPFSTKDLIYNVDFRTPEEANETAIKYCLENLI